MTHATKSLNVLFFISVLLNVFLIGYTVSSHLNRQTQTHTSSPPPHDQGPQMQFEQAKQNLSKEGRAIVDRVLSEQRASLRGNTDNMRKYIHAAERALLAPDLDEQALLKAHQEIDAHHIEMKSNLSEAIYKIAVQLSPEDRIEFFRNTIQGPPPPPRR